MAKVNPIPQDARTVTPTLTISDCAKAIDFYKRALGAEELERFPAPDGKAIWHASVRVGDSTVFMNDEMPGSPVKAPAPDRLASVGMWLYVTDCDAAFKRAIDAGAKAAMQPADMFWGDRTGEVIDPFGYRWTFATHVKDMTKDEMRRGGEEFARQAGQRR
jgi:PhnB protein